MPALLRQRRWWTFCLLVGVVAMACGLLSRWQWGRYELRQEQNAQLDAALSAPVAPLADLLSPGQDVPEHLQYRAVSVTGHYDGARTSAVRGHPLKGRNGFWIVTPLVTTEGVVLVNRGWTAATGDARSTPTVAAPPAGMVTAVGRIRPGEATDSQGAPPAGQAWAVDPDVLLGGGQEPVFDAYVQLSDTTQPGAEQLSALPLPGHRGTNNLVYAVQWILFGLVAVIGGWRLVNANRSAASSLQPRQHGPDLLDSRLDPDFRPLP